MVTTLARSYRSTGSTAAMGKATAAVIFEAVRLAVAVLVYTQLDPKCVALVAPAPPIIGSMLAAVVAALLTLLIFWLLTPTSTIEIVLKNTLTRQAVAGPIHPVATLEFNAFAARFDIELRIATGGLLARKILSHAASKGPTVDVDFRSFTTAKSGTGTNTTATETSSGISITPLQGPPADGTWTWCSVNLGVDQLPTSAIEAAVEPRVSYGAKLFFAYAWLVRVRCPVKIIRIN